MKSVKLCVAVSLALVFCSAMTLAKPNFSGNWKMNAEKSDFGMMPAPSSLDQKITHEEPSLKVATTWVGDYGDFTMDFSYTTDGKECVNTSQMGESKSTLKWDGDALLIDSKMDFQGTEVTISDKWVLSEDGKMMTVTRHFSSDQGEGDATIVLDKQ